MKFPIKYFRIWFFPCGITHGSVADREQHYPSLHTPSNLADIRRKEAEYKRKMAENYNKRHRAIPLPALKPEQNVHIRDRKEDGVVKESANNSPRSYNVKTPCKTIRRNRRDLILIPNYRKCER